MSSILIQAVTEKLSKTIIQTYWMTLNKTQSMSKRGKQSYLSLVSIIALKLTNFRIYGKIETLWVFRFWIFFQPRDRAFSPHDSSTIFNLLFFHVTRSLLEHVTEHQFEHYLTNYVLFFRYVLRRITDNVS